VLERGAIRFEREFLERGAIRFEREFDFLLSVMANSGFFHWLWRGVPTDLRGSSISF